MFHISDRQLVISELFLQSTFDCARSCPGCYVKSHINSNELLPISAWKEVILSFGLGWNTTKQMSFSLDTPPADPNKAIRMLDIAQLLESVPPSKNFSLHLTARDVSTVELYTRFVDFNTVDEVALSDITELTTANHSWLANFLLRRGGKINTIIRSNANSEYLSKIIEVYPLLNTKYIVMDKPCNYWKDRQKLTDVYFNLLSRTNDPNIVVDVCYDYFPHHSCSAGISKFTIWPDGGVSGCPYQKASTPPATNYQEVMNNFVTAHRKDWFETCPMKGTDRA